MKQQTRGLTVIEVLVAISILSVLVVSVLAVMPSLYRTNSSTNDGQMANTYARSVMEAFRMSWLTPVTPPTGSTDRYPSFTAGSTPTLPTIPTSLTCDPPTVTNQTPSAPIPSRRGITVTCTSKRDAKKFEYTAQFGRPE